MIPTPMKNVMGPTVVNAVAGLVLVVAVCVSFIEHTEVVSLQPGAALLIGQNVTRREVSLRGSTYPVKFVKVSDMADVELAPVHAEYLRNIDAGAGADVHLGTVQYSHEVRFRVTESGCESANLEAELRYVSGRFGHPHVELAQPVARNRSGYSFCPLTRGELYELDLAVPPQPLADEISTAHTPVTPRGSLLQRMVWAAKKQAGVLVETPEPRSCPLALEVVLDLQSPRLRAGTPLALNETGLTRMAPPFLLVCSEDAPYLNRVELSVRPARTVIFPTLGVCLIIVVLTTVVGLRHRAATHEEAPAHDAPADKNPAPK